MRGAVLLKPKPVVAAVAIAAACVAGVGSSTAAPSLPVPLPVVNPTVPPDRAVEPVVMTGAEFPGHRRARERDRQGAVHRPRRRARRAANTDNCDHNEYSPPQVDTSGVQNQLPVKGVYPDQLLGYRWQPARPQVRPDPVPGRQGLHPLPGERRLGLRDLLGRRPADHLPVAARGLPGVPRSQGSLPRALPAGREGPDPVLRHQRRGVVHVLRQRPAGASQRTVAEGDHDDAGGGDHRPATPGRAAQLRVRDGRRPEWARSPPTTPPTATSAICATRPARRRRPTSTCSRSRTTPTTATRRRATSAGRRRPATRTGRRSSTRAASR